MECWGKVLCANIQFTWFVPSGIHCGCEAVLIRLQAILHEMKLEYTEVDHQRNVAS